MHTYNWLDLKILIFLALACVIAAGQGNSSDAAKSDAELESSEEFKARVQKAIAEKKAQLGADDAMTKEIETYVLEQSIKEYESRMQAVMKRKRDSLAIIAEKEEWDSAQITMRKRELDSLEQSFKEKKADLLAAPVTAQPPPEPASIPAPAQKSVLRRSRDASIVPRRADTQVIVVGTQPQESAAPSSIDSLNANPFIQWLSRNFMSSTGTREQITTIDLGMNFYLSANSQFYDYFLSNAGFRFGFLFPFKTPVVVTYYRVRAMFHKAQKSQEDTTSFTYLTGTNEILVGKNFFVKNQPFEYVPFAGVGFNNGIIVEKVMQAGIAGREVHYFWFWTLGAMMKRHIEIKNYHIAVGGMLTYENAFVVDPDPTIKDEAMKRRLGLSAIISY